MIKINKTKNIGDNELEYLLEAASFALSRPLKVRELAEILDEEELKVRSTLKKIRKKMKKARFAFIVDEIASDTFMMKITRELEEKLKDLLKEEDIFKFNNIEIDILTTIAYQQPVRKSDLPKIIDKYPKSDITKSLDTLQIENYIIESKEKNAVILRTTNRFALEFGFSTELRTLKQQLHWRLKRNA
jgi:chromosome segregation and condensation protein ScpB